MNELANLEREVELARARLAGNLSTLVSTETYSEFKEDVKDEARSAVANIVENLKARAAANPVAALAIGAGLTVVINAFRTTTFTSVAVRLVFDFVIVFFIVIKGAQL